MYEAEITPGSPAFERFVGEVACAARLRPGFQAKEINPKALVVLLGSDYLSHVAQDEHVARAQLIATVAHEAIGQTRDDGKTPYIVHPKAVVETLRSAFSLGGIWYGRLSKEEESHCLAAAWGHDTLEDTGLTPAYLRAFRVRDETTKRIVLLTKPAVKQLDAVKRSELMEIHHNEMFDDKLAPIVKFADRGHNIEMASLEVVKSKQIDKQIDRWSDKAIKTRIELIQRYNANPDLRPMGAKLEEQVAHLENTIRLLKREIARQNRRPDSLTQHPSQISYGGFGAAG
ncbi:MAG TPA: hypothetical protein VGZ00_10700 [Candidatus Baltobacteraceae bacterium]|jgi:(p)ppGpp synthase/HD superfamily hydrolase|nr:hypothetical protein [Candidatus Baltobacteraceae bacterium]